MEKKQVNISFEKQDVKVQEWKRKLDFIQNLFLKSRPFILLTLLFFGLYLKNYNKEISIFIMSLFFALAISFSIIEQLITKLYIISICICILIFTGILYYTNLIDNLFIPNIVFWVVLSYSFLKKY